MRNKFARTSFAKPPIPDVSNQESRAAGMTALANASVRVVTILFHISPQRTV